MPPRDTQKKSGFTLLELLLVISLLAIAMGVVTPLFFNSLRGQRLNAAARALITASRYARSMSVLKNTDMTIRFDLDTSRIEVLCPGGGIPPFERAIERVVISGIEIDGEPPRTDGTCEIIFRSNGTCRPFTVKISDPNENYILLKIDALAGVRAMESGADAPR